MVYLYNFVIFLYGSIIRLVSLFGNKKAGLWINGRKNWNIELRNAVSKKNTTERFWFHCASLGEFEQGRTLIEKVRSEFPNSFIVLSFFSPSGYEIRKNYSEVDHVCYLPLDTKSNAKEFIDILQPSKTFFIKYEFWYHFINELEKQKRSVYVVSAIFRPQQLFFKWYGNFYRRLLSKINQIFIQDQNSSLLLKGINITNFQIVGDTRFDRVKKVADEAKEISKIENFIGGSRTIVAGSTWPKDDELVLTIFHALDHNDLKLILVPHDVNPERIKELQNIIEKKVNSASTLFYSDEVIKKNASIMIVDTVGILSALYKYSTIAWVGGGFDNGIHNILEPAAHGKPIFFGPIFSKFKEAHELIAIRSAFAISNGVEGKRMIQKLLDHENLLTSAGRGSADYVKKNTGATELIFKLVFNNSGNKKTAGIQQTIQY